MNWFITIPAWGERHIGLFQRYCLPSIQIAAERAGIDFELCIHTDDSDRVTDILERADVRALVLPTPNEPNKHRRLGLCHRDGLVTADQGEVVGFINADHVVSAEIFEAAERRFAEGKRLIMMAGTRTLGGMPPVGAPSAELLAWTMEYAHPTIRQSFFGEGHSSVCSTVYFRTPTGIVLRAWHLHPFAMVKDRELGFTKVTIDDDLIECFAEHETHVVTDRNEASMAELSPQDLGVPDLGRPMDVEAIVHWAANGVASKRHGWLFTHRIQIEGDGADLVDRAICDEALARFVPRTP